MPAMTKRVNVRTVVAVRTIDPPISGTVSNVIMSTSDILKCLCRRAIVDEILPNGKTIRLNMRNYYLDNGAGLDAYHPVQNVAKPENTMTEAKQQNTDIKFNANIVPPPEEEAPIVEETKALSDPEAKKPEETVVETTSEDVESVDKNEEQIKEAPTEEVKEESESESGATEKSTINANPSKKNKRK